jgi:hypothetical protein
MPQLTLRYACTDFQGKEGRIGPKGSLGVPGPMGTPGNKVRVQVTDIPRMGANLKWRS